MIRLNIFTGELYDDSTGGAATGATGFVGASIIATPQSIPSGTDTVLVFESANNDTNNFFDPGEPSRLTPQENDPEARYWIFGQVELAPHSGGSVKVYVRANGIVGNALAQVMERTDDGGTDSSESTILQVTAILRGFDGNDYVELFVLQTSGAPVDIVSGNGHTHFKITKLGGVGAPGVDGVGGASEQDVFMATSGQTAYTCSASILAGSARVTINGLLQPKTEYSTAGAVMTFNNGTGIFAGDIVIVSYLK